MFQKINAIADKIGYLVNRTEYVFKIVVWGIEGLRVVSDHLRKFPIAPIAPKNESNAVDNKPAAEPSVRDGVQP